VLSPKPALSVVKRKHKRSFILRLRFAAQDERKKTVRAEHTKPVRAEFIEA
jgi:hypothetical protein